MMDQSLPIESRQVVVALFDDRRFAEQAVRDLQREGFERDRISVLLRHNEADVSARELVEIDREANEEGTGIAVGSTVGGLAGLLGGLAMFSIPGIGPLLGIGVLATTVGGAALGAAAGERFAADHDWVLPEENAQRYRTAVESGSVVMAVETRSPEEVIRARQALAEHGAEEVEVRPRTN